MCGFVVLQIDFLRQERRWWWRERWTRTCFSFDFITGTAAASRRTRITTAIVERKLKKCWCVESGRDFASKQELNSRVQVQSGRLFFHLFRHFFFHVIITEITGLRLRLLCQPRGTCLIPERRLPAGTVSVFSCGRWDWTPTWPLALK